MIGVQLGLPAKLAHLLFLLTQGRHPLILLFLEAFLKFPQASAQIQFHILFDELAFLELVLERHHPGFALFHQPAFEVFQLIFRLGAGFEDLLLVFFPAKFFLHFADLLFDTGR